MIMPEPKEPTQQQMPPTSDQVGIDVPTPIDKIPRTAYGVAADYALLTEIPFSGEIYQSLRRINPDLKERIGRIDSSYFEARFLMTNTLLDEFRITQIFEIASGFSARGLQRTQDPSVRYVGLDLPQQMEVIKKVIDDLSSRNIFHPGSHFFLEEGSALEVQDLARAARHFEINKPIGIICEGLLRYLNKKEIAQVAIGILSVLKKFGGVWITPDINLGTYNPSAVKTYSHGINKSRSGFGSVQSAIDFFESIGFNVETREYSEELKTSLISAKKMGLSREQIDKTLSHNRVFIFRAKQQI